MNLLSINEGPMVPDCSALCSAHGIRLTAVSSMRKALSRIKGETWDFILCEFEYRYGTDYAGCTVSNLDVMMATLQKYSPATKVIAVVDKSERQYVEKLTAQFPLHRALVYPAGEDELRESLGL